MRFARLGGRRGAARLAFAGSAPMLDCSRRICRIFKQARRQSFSLRLQSTGIGLLTAALLFAAYTASAADLVETTKLLRTGEYAACAASATVAIEENAYNENF